MNELQINWGAMHDCFNHLFSKFAIKEDLYVKYVENEVKKDPDLSSLLEIRQDPNFDWTVKTPLGGAGTLANGLILYCLIRHYNFKKCLETGVSGGFYSSFMLSALKKNDDNFDLTSLEISSNLIEVGKFVPNSLKYLKNWNLVTGVSSIESFKDYEEQNNFQLYSHDSLHTMSHMLKELEFFKKSTSNFFIVFIDDQHSDDFWNRILKLNLIKRVGYNVTSTNISEIGGFLIYEKIK